MGKNHHDLKNAEFTKDMRKSHDIYMPQMIHYHNRLLQAAFAYGGYRLKVVPEQKKFCANAYSTANRDYCTCATQIVGNLLTFVENNKDIEDKIAFLEPQAGGACRAGNYYNLIIDCLKKTNHKQIPVLSLNAHGLEKHKGFKINLKMLLGAIAGVCYSDLIMTLSQQIKPYEANKGDTETLKDKWLNYLDLNIRNGKKLFNRKKIYRQIINEFKSIKVNGEIQKTKVGIVGEIYIKFSPIGNFHLEEFLEKQNCEFRQGGFVNYCTYVVYSEMSNMILQGKNKHQIPFYKIVLKFLKAKQQEISICLRENGFKADTDFDMLMKYSEKYISNDYNVGDGWLITAEAIDLLKQGYDKILVVHPFGCLVSHVGARGVIRKIQEDFPQATITSIEYDLDQSNTLRESRILLAIN